MGAAMRRRAGAFAVSLFKRIAILALLACAREAEREAARAAGGRPDSLITSPRASGTAPLATRTPPAIGSILSRERHLPAGVTWRTILSDSVVRIGEPVEIRVVMWNATPSFAVVRVPGGREVGVDVVVSDSLDQIVWHHNYGVEPDLKSHPIQIPAGDSLRWTVVWTQRDTLERQVLPGIYSIRGVMADRYRVDSGTGAVRLRIAR